MIAAAPYVDGQGLLVAGIGVGLGLAGALALGGVVQSLLFGVDATDPATFVGVAGLMLLTAALACWIPARRATQVDPVTVLRSE